MSKIFKAVTTVVTVGVVAVVGKVVYDVMMDKSQIELGYVIHPDYHNHGYATEALLAVIDDLFEKGYQEVMAGAFVENKASIHVMEKCKMKRIDKEEDIYCQKQWKHCVYYSICKDKM